jgi:uncharacterized membrane protein
MIETIFHFLLILSVLLSSLVGGLLFGFAVVVMPGIAKLSDKKFLLSFKHMDEVIQNNQPLFMLVWVGSIIAVISTAILELLFSISNNMYLILLASSLYLVGVQLPTIRRNIPLNNSLQALDINTTELEELAIFRNEFELSWNRWNKFRTIGAFLSVSTWLMLLIIL